MTHREMLVRSRLALTHDVCEFIDSAPYNSGGMTWLLVSLWEKTPTCYWNESSTYTSDNLASMLESLRRQRIFMTPCVLKCLAETYCGVKALQDCQNVGSFGAPCPTPLGDMLMTQGVSTKHLCLVRLLRISVNDAVANSLNSTETGILMAYNSALGDADWAYLAPLPHCKDHIWMRPIDSENHERVVFKNCVGLCVTNSDEPPGSYHTKDLFVAHKTLPNRWQFVVRIDDRFAMGNGEDVLPLEFEGAVGRRCSEGGCIVWCRTKRAGSPRFSK